MSLLCPGEFGPGWSPCVHRACHPSWLSGSFAASLRGNVRAWRQRCPHPPPDTHADIKYCASHHRTHHLVVKLEVGVMSRSVMSHSSMTSDHRRLATKKEPQRTPSTLWLQKRMFSLVVAAAVINRAVIGPKQHHAALNTLLMRG